MKHCSRCNAGNDDKFSFCLECGNSLSQVDVTKNHDWETTYPFEKTDNRESVQQDFFTPSDQPISPPLPTAGSTHTGSIGSVGSTRKSFDGLDKLDPTNQPKTSEEEESSGSIKNFFARLLGKKS